MQICDTLFLASGEFHDINTLPYSESASEEQSKPNWDSEAHITTFDVESYFQHTLEIPFTVTKCGE